MKLAIVVLLATSGVALAEDYAEYNVEARPHVKLAIEAFGREDYTTSVREWEAAWAIDRNPKLLYGWAQAERFAKRCGLAITHYRQYLGYKISDDGQLAARGAIALCLETINKTACDRTTIAPDGTPIIVTTPSETPWYKDPIGGAIVGGTIAAGVGIGFLIAASGAHDDARNQPTLEGFSSALEDATTYRRIGLTSIIVGGVLAGGALVYHFKFRVEASPSGGAVAIAGAF